MNAILKKFRVKKFRSIVDSGWLKLDNQTCLVGTNESGKTNLIVALWKLNPANDEEIVPLIDYPRKEYVNFEKTHGEEIFVEGEFEFKDSIADQISEKAGWHRELVKSIIISRNYNGEYFFQFSKSSIDSISTEEVISLFEKAVQSYKESSTAEREDQKTNETILSKLNEILDALHPNSDLDQKSVVKIKEEFEVFLRKNYGRKQYINNFFYEEISLFAQLDKIIAAFNENGIEVTNSVEEIITNNLPSFVYYSDYGNLDSEIYLPHVIENFDRDDLGEKERAKSRSLKVLFEFVNLSPEQILELGKEALPRKVVTQDQRGKVISTQEQDASEEDIETIREKKKEREILLQSASTKLTQEFKDWWKQGNYKFRFQADGNFFRIWVSDEVRQEEIELEGRSRGLQWFFSFFLVFLVESKDSHSNCILLLDEPGISLHPVAQLDLIRFFHSLAIENQLIYTTHSPFLVDSDNLGNVYAMYVGQDGESIISADLRSNNKIAEKSIYPVHAAIGLTVSETLLIGCQPVLVEGVSDQIYLQLIKQYALQEGAYKNDREIVFIPTGGVKGMSPVIKILLGRDNALPFVILDSDRQGKQKEKQLRNGLYKGNEEKIVVISEFLGDGDWEIEDLMDKEQIARLFAKSYRRRNSEDEFEYLFDASKPIVNQMESFASENGYHLGLGWKVDLAKEVQKNFDRILTRTDQDMKTKWIKILEKITNENAENKA